jgi:oxygen-independent coproporphyrinogen-3 oxidase
MLRQGKLPVSEKEAIDKDMAMAETMFLGLHLLEGVEKEYFLRKHGVCIEERYKKQVKGLTEKGLLRITPI